MAGVSSKAGSPSFEATFSPSGRETHFAAVLGGEDAVEYLFCGYLYFHIGPGGGGERGGAGSGIQWVTSKLLRPCAEKYAVPFDVKFSHAIRCSP